MNKLIQPMHIIQFLPYFPPHKGGLETVAEEIGIYWVKSGFGLCINIITDFDQEVNYRNHENVVFDGEVIGYIKHGVINLVVPSFEIISNFPVYKIWSRKYRLIKRYLQEHVGKELEKYRLITHTRFFLTSFIGGKFAQKYGFKRVHIEHGSDYVKLSSSWKNILAYIYDRLIGKRIFSSANKILAISNACREFILTKFVDREVEVFYRGVDIDILPRKKVGDIKIVFIGRLVVLKGVQLLVASYKKLQLQNELLIIGSGEEKEALESLAADSNNISFLGFKDKEFIVEFLSTNNCILVNPSFQEGLPTTVIEGLLTENVVVASNVGGTTEISDQPDLITFEAGNKNDLEEKLLLALSGYQDIKGMSKAGVQEKFSWEKSVYKICNLIK